MKFSLLTLSLIAGAALTVAAPSPKKGPPGPPSGTVYGASQSCSASQSSISCCNAKNNGSNKKNVYYPGGNAELTCSQIDTKGQENKQVQEICSTTVACCQGDGCTAIAY